MLQTSLNLASQRHLCKAKPGATEGSVWGERVPRNELQPILRSPKTQAGLRSGAFGVFPTCWSELITCSWRAREMGGSHEVPAGAAEIQLPEALACTSQPVQTIRHSKHTFFISIRKEKAALPPYLLKAMKNLEPACAVEGLICCGCLINKAVVYLITFPHSNCKGVSDVRGLCCSSPAVKQMCHCLPLKRTDQHPNPPSGRTWGEAKTEGGSQPKCKEHAFLFLLQDEKTSTCVHESQAMKSDYFHLKYSVGFLQQHLKVGKFLANFTGQLNGFFTAFWHFPSILHYSVLEPCLYLLQVLLLAPALRASKSKCL